MIRCLQCLSHYGAAIRKRLNIDIDPEASLADYYYLDDLRLQKWATHEASLDLGFQGDETKILHMPPSSKN